jgi:ribosomal protein S18 acetylase RimI-like enzyme
MLFVLRFADINDAKLLSELGKICFSEAFGKANPEEDLKHYLEESFKEEGIKNDLTNPAISYLIVEDENFSPVGYAKLNRNTHPEELNGARAIQLNRIYVRQKVKKKKAGALMMQKCIEIAKNEHYQFIWLAVWEENKEAIEFYHSWGFEICGHRYFKIGNKIDDDYMMKKQILFEQPA